MNPIIIGKFIARKRKQKNLLYGVIIIFMGIALQILSYRIRGTDSKDFISGLLVGISLAVD